MNVYGMKQQKYIFSEVHLQAAKGLLRQCWQAGYRNQLRSLSRINYDGEFILLVVKLVT